MRPVINYHNTLNSGATKWWCGVSDSDNSFRHHSKGKEGFKIYLKLNYITFSFHEHRNFKSRFYIFPSYNCLVFFLERFRDVSKKRSRGWNVERFMQVVFILALVLLHTVLCSYGLSVLTFCRKMKKNECVCFTLYSREEQVLLQIRQFRNPSYETFFY